MKKILLFILLCQPLWAVDRFVDNNDPNCTNGTGLTTAPFCRIDDAVDYAGLAAGDRIKVRNGNTYDERIQPPIGKNGTAGSHIYIEADSGHTPTIRSARTTDSQHGAITLLDVNYWTIQNLTFNGSAARVVRHAVLVKTQTGGTNPTGNEIKNCTFTSWGANSANLEDSEFATIMVSGLTALTRFPVDTIIQDNTFTASRHSAIRNIYGSLRTVIDGNTISGTLEGRGSVNLTQAPGYKQVNILTVWDGLNSGRTIVRNNTISNNQTFASGSLQCTGNSTSIGFWSDINSDFGQFTNNVVHNIDPSKTSSSNSRSCPTATSSYTQSWNIRGVLIEAGCDNWTVRENIIYRIGMIGLANGTNTSDPNNNQYLNNVIFSIGQDGFVHNKGHNLTFKNNVIFNAGTASGFIVRVSDTNGATGDGPHTYNNNDYFNTAGGNEWCWGSCGSGETFSTFKSNCVSDGNTGCDAASLNVTPEFVSTSVGTEDFHLQATSDLINAGDAGSDIGAYPFEDPGGGGEDPNVSVLFPNGGESFSPGETFNILWDSDDGGDMVIKFSCSDFATSATLTGSGTPDDGSFEWTVPADQGARSNCKMEVSSETTPASFDRSDAYFRIRGIRLLSAQ